MRVLRYIVADNDIRYPDDVDRIRKVLHEAGFDVSAGEAQRMWDEYSDSMCAGWMMASTYSDAQLLDILTTELDNSHKDEKK